MMVGREIKGYSVGFKTVHDRNQALLYLEAERLKFEADVYYKDRYSEGPLHRISRKKELIKLGVPFEECHSGLVVEGQHIISASSNSYQYPTSGKWYSFRDMDSLLRRLDIQTDPMEEK